MRRLVWSVFILLAIAFFFGPFALGQVRPPVTQGPTNIKGNLTVYGNIEGRSISMSGTNLMTLFDSKMSLGSTPWATPGPIGVTTPNTGKFTDLNFTGQFKYNGSAFAFSHLAGNPTMNQLCPNGTPDATTFLRGDCQWVNLTTLAGLGDPGVNGLLKRTAFNVTAPVTLGDLQALIGSGGIRTNEVSDGIKLEPVSMTLIPPGTNDTILFYDSTISVTFLSLRCQIDSGTNVVVKLQKVPWDFQSNTPVDMLSSYTATATSVDSSVTVGNVPAHTAVMLKVVSVSGTVNTLWCRAEYRKDIGQ